MKLKIIKLRNFKRFDDLTINLGNNPKKIIALVGPNGCGKSSVFDAFEEKLKDYKSATQSEHASYFSKLWHSIIPENKSESYNKNDSILLTRDDDSNSFDKKSFYIRSAYRFTSKLKVDSIKVQPDIIEDRNRPYSCNALDYRMQANYERLLSKLFHEFEQGDKTGTEVRRELLEVINGILENILEVKISSLGNVGDDKGQLFFEKGNSKGFPYENLSSGEKEVVDIVTDLVIKTPDFNNTIYCIDEPELHLNTAIQRKLLIEIEKLIPDSCQLWVATHSIGFLRALQEELKEKSSILDFSEKDYFNGTKEMHPITPIRENWRRIFETALEDLTGLMAPKRIIYCEGRKEADENGDESGLDAQIYNEIFSESEADTLFVSSGGNTEPDNYSLLALKILNKAFNDVELWLLKDKDINRDGTPTTDEQRDEFIAKDPAMNKMLKRKEIENYLFDFEILSSQYTLIAREEYDAIISDINNGNVKDVVGQIMSLCGITTGIDKQTFKKILSKKIVPGTTVYAELLECIFSK